MGDLEDSVQRHPAGNARKETIWDTSWAISKAMQVGREQEQERIIKLLEDNFYPLEYGRWQADELLDEIFTLIKGENE